MTDATTLLLRKRGLVPWEWIVDETRHLRTWKVARTGKEYLLVSAEQISLDRWPPEDPAPLIFTESRSLAGVLYGLASTQ